MLGRTMWQELGSISSALGWQVAPCPVSRESCGKVLGDVIYNQGLPGKGLAWSRCQQRELRLLLICKTRQSCWTWLFQALGPAGDGDQPRCEPCPHACPERLLSCTEHGVGLGRGLHISGCMGCVVRTGPTRQWGGTASPGLSPPLWGWGDAAEPGRSLCWAGTVWARTSVGLRSPKGRDVPSVRMRKVSECQWVHVVSKFGG